MKVGTLSMGVLTGTHTQIRTHTQTNIQSHHHASETQCNCGGCHSVLCPAVSGRRLIIADVRIRGVCVCVYGGSQGDDTCNMPSHRAKRALDLADIVLQCISFVTNMEKKHFGHVIIVAQILTVE